MKTRLSFGRILVWSLAIIALAAAITISHRRAPATTAPAESWLPVPANAMDAESWDVRHALLRSATIADPDGGGDGDALVALCSAESRTMPAERYAALVRIPDSDPYLNMTKVWYVEVDIEGHQAQVRTRNGQVATPFGRQRRSRLVVAPYANYLLNKGELEDLRETWRKSNLWSPVNTRGCAIRIDPYWATNETFVEACIHGRYFAREHRCTDGSETAALARLLKDRFPPPRPAQ
ncbi:hypothetical protein [Lysobacter sp. TAB13]|uniref:hypothetical protein n=1 Tax=Lysobacter sp. TAB13 TaxID=3233065 RepID=UPI003F999B2C